MTDRADLFFNTKQRWTTTDQTRFGRSSAIVHTKVAKIMPQYVVLDTNALLMPFQFGLNLDLELQRLLGDPTIIVPAFIRRELAALARSNRTAATALRLAAKYEEPPPVDPDQDHDNGDEDRIRALPVDDRLIVLARALGAFVVTNDRALLTKLATARISTIALRGGSHLVLTERR